MPTDPNQLFADAYEWLHGNLAGFLRFDGERLPMRVAPLSDGHLAAPVMVAMLTAADLVLELPDDGDDDLHLMISLEPFDTRGEGGAWSDRWRAYHGQPEDVNWARLMIDAVKFRGHYIDGTMLMRANPLAAEESALCRRVNAEFMANLARYMAATTNRDAEAPVLVGVDPWGLDVRRRFEVVRVPAPSPWSDAAAVMATLQSA